MSDDAGVDVNGTGAGIEDAFDEITGDLDNSGATFYYGITAWVMVLATYLAYEFTFEESKYIAFFMSYLWEVQTAWWAPAWGWLILSFFDNEATRAIFGLSVMWSLRGPFVYHWVSLIQFIHWADFGETGAYIWTAIHVVFGLVQILLQALLIPSVLQWIETAAYYNEEYEEEPLIDEAEEEEDDY